MGIYVRLGFPLWKPAYSAFTHANAFNRADLLISGWGILLKGLRPKFVLDKKKSINCSVAKSQMLLIEHIFI